MKKQSASFASPGLSAALSLLCIFFLFAGCSPFSALQSCVSGDCSSQSSQGSGSGSPQPSPQDSSWTNLSLDGQVNGGVFGQTSVLQLDKVNKLLIVQLPMLGSVDLNGATAYWPIPQLQGAQLSLTTLTNGEVALVLKLPLTYLVHGATFLPSAKLPNGDPLPAVASGEMPSVAIALNALKGINATLYLDVNQVGIFVNTSMDPVIGWTYPLRNAANTIIWGYLSAIPAKSSTVQGGFFLSLAIPADIARVIDDNI